MDTAPLPDADSPAGKGKALVDDTASAIRARILSGEIPIGAQLRQVELAEMLGVSRTPSGRRCGSSRRAASSRCCPTAAPWSASPPPGRSARPTRSAPSSKGSPASGRSTRSPPTYCGNCARPTRRYARSAGGTRRQRWPGARRGFLARHLPERLALHLRERLLPHPDPHRRRQQAARPRHQGRQRGVPAQRLRPRPPGQPPPSRGQHPRTRADRRGSRRGGRGAGPQ